MSNVAVKKNRRVLNLLEENYPEFKGGLSNYSSPFQLLVAAILSAQSTDKQVNSVTKDLFLHFPSPPAFASASLEEIEKAIAKVGLYKNKARFIKEMSRKLIDEYNSIIPTSIKELTQLPGIGRKTANVLLNDWFEIHEGIAVDTHVKRLSYRLGWTKNKNPIKIEQDLMQIIPIEKWGRITHLLISHGRAICKAQKPRCLDCFLSEYCPKFGVSE
ncbi:MAG: endonuclease III [Candidatus Heimdallarchaeaceae archaeon]|jgi:endonuclease-3